MKTIVKRAALIGFFSLFILVSEQSFAAKVSPAPHGSVSFQVFYDELSPYGSWVSYQSYGYAWIPSADAGFVPYSTGGHWVLTDFGWTWASTYNWGWAPFHYGNWVYDDFYGWIWVPGYEWAPAWVVWGSYDTYYGWAPIGPGVTVFAGYRPPPHYWVFCNSRYINDVHINRYIVTSGVPREKVVIIDNRDSNHGYYYGPRKEAVEKVSGKSITRVAVVERNSPAPTRITANKMEVYRPDITKGSATPPKVKKLDEVQPVNKTKGNTNVQQKGNTNVPQGGGNTNVQKKENVNMQKKGNDDVYQHGGQGTERKSYTPPTQSNQPKAAPQQKANPDVQKKGGGNIEPKKSMPQQKAPAVQERNNQERIVPQDKGGNMNEQREAAPQQATPDVQERSMPQQNAPQQKQEQVAPQQHNNPPVQQKMPSPSQGQPHQKKGHVSPR